jgi:DNA-binding PadR family transcriptional regulator
MPRRKPGTLLPLELDILVAALSSRDGGDESFHGFGLAQTLRERRGSRALTAHGTLYKALGRLEDRGLLASRWEEPPAAEGRPRRRLYTLTAEGERAAREAPAAAPSPSPARRSRTAPRPA